MNIFREMKREKKKKTFNKIGTNLEGKGRGGKTIQQEIRERKKVPKTSVNIERNSKRRECKRLGEWNRE